MVVFVGGVWGWWGLVGVLTWCVSGPVPGGGGGGCGTGGGGGERGLVLHWMGVWASCRVLWVSCVRVVRSSRSLAGRVVELGGGCLGIRGGLWSVGSGRLLVDCARWHWLRLRGLPVVVGCSL